MELTENAMRLNEFDKGYHFGRQELFYFLLNNAKYRVLKEGEFVITLDTIQKLLKEETDKNGSIK
jgi:hypothetical protein